VTESAIAEAAVAKYLEPDRRDEALILRRLDSVAQVLGRVEERLEVVAEAVARFVLFSLKVAPEKVPADAAKRAEGQYQGFVGMVSRAVGTGTTFLAAVRRERLNGARAPGPAAQGEQ
jgi:hypothetical protein